MGSVDHITGNKLDDGIWMSGCIVEELGEGFGSGFSSIGLGCGQIIKSNQHGIIYSSGVEEECPHNLLGSLVTSLVKGSRCVMGLGKLWAFSIGWLNPFMGGVFLSGGSWMVEALEGFVDIARHGHVEEAVGIVPIKVDSTELSAFPVGCDIVFGREGVKKVLGIFFSRVLDSKIIHY